MGACTYLGPEFDPRTHNYMTSPTPYCGCQTLEGKNYCADHYYVVYKKGSAFAGRKAEKAIEAEIAELKRAQELEEIENE